MSGLPLLRGFDLDDAFAYQRGKVITTRQFIQHVGQVARALPERGYVLNACRSRYAFCVAFAAALAKEQTTLMPPNQTADTLERLRSGYPDVYRVDDSVEADCPLPTIRLPELATSERLAVAIPHIDPQQVAAVMFTSGSTGAPIAHTKTWESLVASGRAEAARLGLAGSRMSVLATVPPQHMYGLESSVMMPMQNGLAMHGWMPFYPADVCRAIDELPRPRVLISTPVHLRALVADADAVPHVDLILCATAPLAPQLATLCERKLGAPLHEIYGCTEAGQIATRRTVRSGEWRLLRGLRLRDDHEGTWVSGGHVPGEVLLGDVIERNASRRFLLHGRKSDLVNIAGKRTSLAHLNFQLNSIAGVRDGVFIVPEDTGQPVPRLMAFVVAPGLTRESLTEALLARIDPAFMPRPLRLVDSLPRNATGKLPHAAVQALAAETLLER